MKRKYELYLLDIVEYIKKILVFTKDVTFDDFKHNEEKVLAVTKCLENIGEAVAQIDDSIKEKYPEIPWRDIKDFRNIIVHKYWGIEVEREWDIVEKELDVLLKKI